MNNEIKGGVSAILNTDKVVYTGGDTGSAVVSVDNYDRVIYADVNDEILDKVYTRIPDNKLNKYLMPLPYETDGNKIKIWYNVDEQGWNQFEGLKCGDCYYFFHEDTKTLYF